MKIKRFLAPNMREALKAVRTEQGPEAVILSNRRVGDYVEVIAALDYDEALIQQAIRRTPRDATDTETTESVETVADQIAESDDETTDVRVLLSAEAQRGTTTTRREQQTLITELDVPAVPEIADLRQQLLDVVRGVVDRGDVDGGFDHSSAGQEASVRLQRRHVRVRRREHHRRKEAPRPHRHRDHLVSHHSTSKPRRTRDRSPRIRSLPFS